MPLKINKFSSFSYYFNYLLLILDIVEAFLTCNKETICSILLRCEMDLNQQIDGSGKTFLHKAVEWKDFDICKELLQKGANVNMRNNIGETALFIVFRDQQNPCTQEQTNESKRQLVKLLLHYNSEIDIKNRDDETVEDLAGAGTDSYVKELIGNNGTNTNSKTVMPIFFYQFSMRCSKLIVQRYQEWLLRYSLCRRINPL